MYDYNSSNAKKLDYTWSDYRRDVQKDDAAKVKSQEKHTKTVRINEAQAMSAVKKMLMIAAAFVVAFFMVRGYVAINETENQIKALSEDLRMVQAENQSIKAKIDKSVDLKNLQAIANEKFGMVRPEKYQVFYVNMNSEDHAENVKKEGKKQDAESIPLEGVTGVLISSADMFK
jgi:cell division protein FtsL